MRHTVPATFLILLTVLLVTQPVFAAHGPIHDDPSTGEVFITLTWGDDELWEFLVLFRTFGLPSDHHSHAPVFLVGDVDLSDMPQTPFGADHVVDVPPQNMGAYNAIWHVLLVEPAAEVDETRIRTTIANPPEREFAPTALVTHVDFTGDGDFVPLTSVETIRRAEEAGLVEIDETETVFVCPVRPVRPL